MTDLDYEELLDKMIVEFSQHPDDYQTADDVVIHLQPDHPMNGKIATAAKHILKISAKDFRGAMERYKKKLDAEIAKMDIAMRRLATLGGEPTDEREYVPMLLTKKGYEMQYNGEFYRNDARVPTTIVIDDLVLTAASLYYTRPKGDMMTNSNINAALDEWMHFEKEEKRTAIWDSVMVLSEGRDKEKILADFYEVVCDKYFKEPGFAMLVLMKFIWQVKCKMIGKEIEAHHFVVIQGEEQFGGKTYIARKLISPLKVLSEETDLSQVIDDRNTALRSQYIVFLDEFSGADRADIAKLKGIITGVDNSSRVLHTHRTQRTVNNMTGIGTNNQPLGNQVFDKTGMRRFIEINPKLRKEVEPYFDAIKAFDWLGVWQAVDPNDPDPIMSNPEYHALLMEKQEEMRAKDNVETWLDFFEVNKLSHYNEVDGAAQFYSEQLYNIFRLYEEQYHPASHGTSLTRWGTDMKSMIARNMAEGWSCIGKKEGKRKTIYRFALNNVVRYIKPTMRPKVDASL